MSDPSTSAGAGPPAATSPAAQPWAASTLIGYAVLVVIAWTALELWGLGKTPFHTKGEPREGLVVWEMTHGGGWILPRRNGVELPSKPPLFHWLGAATSLAHGATDEWSIRFPSAALSLGVVLSVFVAGAALWGARAGLLSALALLTMFEWGRAATNARVDMTLTFGLQLALLSLLFFLRHRSAVWLVPLYLGIALAVLGKGPVGAALPGLVALIMLVLMRDASFLRQMRLGYGALTVGVLAGSWYVLALLLGGWEFFRKQVLAENVFTYLNDPEFGSGGHRHSATYLLGALLLGVLPWTPFLAGTAARLWRQRRELSRHDPRLYLLVWSVVVFGFYALSASKRSVYLLAMYPAVALLLGWWGDEQIRSSAAERWLSQLVRLIALALTVVGVLVGVGALLEGLGAPLVANVARHLSDAAQPFASWVSAIVRQERWPLLGCLLLAGLALYGTTRAARAGRWAGIFAGVFCSAAALFLAVQQVVLPGIAGYQSVREFMAEVHEVVGPTGDLSFYNTFNYEAVFYWHGHIPVYAGPWPDGAPRYLLLQRDEWGRADELAKRQYQAVTFPEDHGLGEHGGLVLIRRVGAE